MVSYGMNSVDLFEANDLFESGNMTQVQVSLLALAGKVRPREGQQFAQSCTADGTHGRLTINNADRHSLPLLELTV